MSFSQMMELLQTKNKGKITIVNNGNFYIAIGKDAVKFYDRRILIHHLIIYNEVIFLKQYNRQKAVEYAKKWAYLRNPNYYNFDNIGGDCTNFVSQCIYAGSNVMNYNKNNGWYYINGNNKSPSWTGVQPLYNFLIQNNGKGPHGIKVEQDTNIYCSSHK